MVAVPEAMPVTTPVDAPTVATEGLLLLHVPPAVASANVTVDPIHTAVLPLIADGRALTVNAAVR